MDNQNNIPVEKVTKPIQLLAAWLIGLILVNTGFLAAAKAIESPSWIPGLLVTAAVLNVPIFLAAIFLLQTKFRPEMQEDSFYSKYLETKTGTYIQPVTSSQLNKVKEELYSANSEIISLVADLQSEISNLSLPISNGKVKFIESKGSIDLQRKISAVANISEWNKYQIRLNNHLKNSQDFKKSLIKNSIPIHGVFGSAGGGFSDPPQIVIGSGFSIGHIRAFINSIADLNVDRIAFAYPEEDDDLDAPDYEKEILIGAYNQHDHGVSLKDAVDIVNTTDISEEAFYSAIKC